MGSFVSLIFECCARYYSEPWMYIIAGITNLATGLIFAFKKPFILNIGEISTYVFIPVLMNFYAATLYYLVASGPTSYSLGLIISMYFILAYAILTKLLTVFTEKRRVQRQALSSCITYEDICKEFQQIDGAILFYDFIHASTSIPDDNEFWIYQRLILYIQAFQRSIDDEKCPITNCTLNQKIQYITQMLEVYKNRFQSEQVGEILELYCQRLTQKILDTSD